MSKLKRIRLPGGKFITRVLPESTPLRLQGAKLEEIWDMGEGRRIVVYDMEMKHLLNAIKFVEAKAKRMLNAASMGDKFEPNVFANLGLVKDYPSYPTMVAELTRRLSAPKVEQPKHARAFNFE